MRAPRWHEVYILSGMRAAMFAGDIAAATAVALFFQSQGLPKAYLVATLIAASAPGVILAPLTGRVSDRFSSRTVLLAVPLLQAVVCLLMAILMTPLALVGLTALLSAGLAFTHPVCGGLPRSMVGPDNVARAASISQTTAMGGMFAAPALGGFLAGEYDTRAAILFNGAMLLVVAACGLLIKTRMHVPKTEDVSVGGARYSAFRDPYLRTLLGAVGLVVLCVSINNVVSVYFVRETLGASKQLFGAVGSAWMAGLVLGSLVVGKNKRLSSTAQVVLAFALMGTALLLISIAPSVWWLVPFNIIGGIGNGTMATNLHVIMNLNVPEEFRGRAFAALGAVSNAAPMTGYFLGGILVANVPSRAAYLIIGLAALICTALAGPRLLRPAPQRTEDEALTPAATT